MTGSGGAIFLSYASEDAAAAQKICAALRAASLEVWFDQSELRGGDAWDAAIRAQIKACALFVPLISRHSRMRVEGYFRLEWKLAIDRSHLMATEKSFLIPVVIDDTTQTDARVPDRFLEVQWTRLPDGETTPAFVDRMRKLLAPVEPRIVSAASTPPAAPAGPRRRLNRLWLSALGVAVLLVAGLVYLGITHRGTIAVSPTAPPMSVVSNDEAQVIPDKSIAVLPFTDLSEKKDQQYFSDGLSEELIDLLVQVPELKVTARTSSFSFRERPVTVAEIGRALNVANILEGSVRKSGNTIRITAQLVRADTGFHLWSATYDRDLKDVFKVQDDIARVVVDKLKLTLAAGNPSTPARTENTEAYTLLLQGRFAQQSDTEAGTADALKFFERAVAIDADYAPAWSGLAYVHFRRGVNGYAPGRDAYRVSEQEARRAIELDSTLAEPYAVLSSIQMLHFEWKDAAETGAKALERDPSNWNALLHRALQTLVTGDPAVAVAQMQEALDHDPLNLLDRRYGARLFFYAGRVDEAERLLRQILAVNPNFSAAHYELGRVLLIRGNTAAAVFEFEKESNPSWRNFGLPLGYHSVHRGADAAAALKTLLADSAGSEFQIGEAYAWFGDSDKAFEWLNKAVTNDPGILWFRHDPLLAGLVADPRYQAILKRLKLSP
jgi:TolB-like protein/Flp pilus assembly protein TadD